MKTKLFIIFLFNLLFSSSVLAQELTLGQKIVAQTILGEARGEGEAGMYAVACVIKQRSINRKLTPMRVCLENRIVKGKRIHQFSCWNYTSLVQHGRIKAKLEALLKTKEGKYAKLLASNIHNVKCDYVKNADHYCTLNTDNYWTRTSKPVKIIGNHKFYKLN